MAVKFSYIVAAGVALAAAAWIMSGQFGDSAEPVAIDPTTGLGNAAPAAGTATTPTTETALPRVRVRRQTAEPRAIEIKLSGRTAANRIVEISAQTRGTVAEILVEKGRPVKAGDVMVRLRTEDREARLRETKALLRQREIEYNAATKLAKKGYKSETSVAEALAQLEQAKAAVAGMEIDLAYTTIRAPFDGIVDARPVEIGDFVDVGEAIAVIVDLDPILVVGEISERDVNKIPVGSEGRALLVTGQSAPGRVRYVAAVAEETTRTFRLELEVPNADWRIMQGISGELHLPVSEQPAHLVSPAILTLSDDGQIGVKIVGPGDIVEFRPVAIIGDGPEGVWLVGLPETVTIITVGQDYVTPGQRVDPVMDSAAPAS